MSAGGATLPSRPPLQFHPLQKSATVTDLQSLVGGKEGLEIKANYGHLREKFLRATPAAYHCKLFCHGKRCKYCNSNTKSYWKDHQMAIPGIYSNWITTDLLAMARPTEEGIRKHNLIEAFKHANIVSIVNLQRMGEHDECGPQLNSAGFSYNAETFMQNGLFHYNFGWPDFGTTELSSLLDMVKVLNFALAQGKVAIHCHAGLGRTGVLICCYLIWHQRFSPGQAIQHVRSKRPGSVQTSDQVAVIHHFAEYLKPLRMVYFSGITFDSYIFNQRKALHGYEERVLRNIPKILYVIGERLLELFNLSPDGTIQHKLSQMRHAEDHQYDKFHLDVQNEIGFMKTLQLANIREKTAKKPRSSSLDEGLKTVESEPNLHKSHENFTEISNGDVAEKLLSTEVEQTLTDSLNMTKEIDSDDEDLSDTEENIDKILSATKILNESASFLQTNEEISENGSTPDNGLTQFYREQTQNCFESLKCDKAKYKEKVSSYKRLVNGGSFCWIKLSSETDAELLFHLIDAWFECFTEPLIIFPKNHDSEKHLKQWQKESLLYMCQIVLCLSFNKGILLKNGIELVARWFTRKPYDRLAIEYIQKCTKLLENRCTRLTHVNT